MKTQTKVIVFPTTVKTPFRLKLKDIKRRLSRFKPEIKIPNFILAWLPDFKQYSTIPKDYKEYLFYTEGAFGATFAKELFVMSNLTKENYKRTVRKYFEDEESKLLYLRLIAQKIGKYNMFKELCFADKRFYDSIEQDLEEVFEVFCGMTVSMEQALELIEAKVKWDYYDLEPFAEQSGFIDIKFDSREDFIKAKQLLGQE